MSRPSLGSTSGPEVAEAMTRELLEAWLEVQVNQRIQGLHS